MAAKRKPAAAPPKVTPAADVVRLIDCALTDVVILPDGRRVSPSWHRTGDVAVRHVPVDGPRGEPEMVLGATPVTVERRGPGSVPETSGPADVDPLRGAS